MNIFKLGLSLIYYVYALYDNEYKRKYLKMLGEFAYIAARCMLVK